MARLTRAESRERTQRLLREAAMREFARFGFAGTSAESIAEEAGFSGGAFYSNYRDKQEILIDLMRSLHTAESEYWKRLVARGKDIDDVIDKITRRAESFVRRKEYLLLSVELDLRAARSPDFRREYAAYRAEVKERAAEMMQIIFSKAGKKPPTNTSIFVDAWLAFATGIGLYCATEANPKLREAMRKQIVVPYFRSMLDNAESL